MELDIERLCGWGARRCKYPEMYFKEVSAIVYGITVKLETLTNLANQGKIAKLKPFKVKPPSKISAFKKNAIQQHLQAIRQHFFRQNSMNQDSSKFNNAKVSSFTVLP